MQLDRRAKVNNIFEQNKINLGRSLNQLEQAIQNSRGFN